MNHPGPVEDTLSSGELVERSAELPALLAQTTQAAATAIGESDARPWALAGLAYLLDPERNELVWLIAQPLDFWQRCGFAERPHHQRFADVVAQLVLDIQFVSASRALARELQDRLGGSPTRRLGR